MIHEPSLLLHRRGPQAGILRGWLEIVIAHIRVGLVNRNGGEIKIVLDKARDEIRLLFRRCAQLEPVARTPRREHVVIGSADIGRGQFLGDDAGGEVIAGASAAIFLAQYEGAKSELRSLFQNVPRNAVFPFWPCVELQRDRLDFALSKFTRHLLERPLFLVQPDIEHRFLISRFLG